MSSQDARRKAGDEAHGKNGHPSMLPLRSWRPEVIEAKLLDGARLIQFMIAGVDFIPLGELPKSQWQQTAAAMPSRWLSTRLPWHLPPPSA